MEQWAYKFESVRTWLSKINGTKALRAQDFFHFCDFTGKNPDELLALKNSYESLTVKKLLDRFVSEAKIPESPRWKSAIAVRSFFRCNYRQLQCEAGKIEYSQKKPPRVPSKKQRLELFKACYNQRDRALVTVICCGAMALETYKTALVLF